MKETPILSPVVNLFKLAKWLWLLNWDAQVEFKLIAAELPWGPFVHIHKGGLFQRNLFIFISTMELNERKVKLVYQQSHRQSDFMSPDMHWHQNFHGATNRALGLKILPLESHFKSKTRTFMNECLSSLSTIPSPPQLSTYPTPTGYTPFLYSTSHH